MPNFLINVTTTGVRGATSGVKKLTSSLGTLTKVGMVSAGAGAIALTAGVKKATAAFKEQELAEKKLSTALGRTSTALLEQASALQQNSVFGDEAIISQQAYLASIGLTEAQIKEMMPVVLDLASATGMTLEGAVKNTAKTLSGMTGELGESVPALKDLTAVQLKAGEGVKLMGEMFDGMAKAEAQTFSGSVTQMKNALGDLMENIGAEFAPSLQASALRIKEFAEQAQGLVKTMFDLSLIHI